MRNVHLLSIGSGPLLSVSQETLLVTKANKSLESNVDWQVVRILVTDTVGSVFIGQSIQSRYGIRFANPSSAQSTKSLLGT